MVHVQVSLNVVQGYNCFACTGTCTGEFKRIYAEENQFATRFLDTRFI